MNEFRCDICDIVTSGVAQFQAHLKGDKHSKRVVLLLGSNRTPVQASSSTSTPEFSSYFCQICDKMMNSEATFRQHIEGSAHRKKMERGSAATLVATPVKPKVAYHEDLTEDDLRSQFYYQNKYLKDVVFIGSSEDIGLKLKPLYSDFD